MNRKGILSAVLASVMTLVLALPSVGRADGGHYPYGPYHGRPPYHGPYYPHYYPRYYPRPQYYPAYPCNNCSKQQHHHNNNNNNDNNDLWYGLLGGGVLGYGLGNIFPIPRADQNYVPPPDQAVPSPQH
jgi:hypothetical protein